jgi:GDP-L-fucose synthase
MTLSESAFNQLLSIDGPPLINIGTGADQTIRELAELIARVLELDCEIVLDPSRPDGTPQKLLDVNRINSLGWKAKTSLEEGIRLTHQSIRDRLEAAAVNSVG